jgi:predicted ATPase/DNA-binding SARP family transcriptional activator
LSDHVPGPDVTIALLGPVQVMSATGPVHLGGSKPRAVLAALALRHGRVVSVDQLIDDLWADDKPATARNTVQVYVSAVRRALARAGSPVGVDSRPAGYLLSGGAANIDWHLSASLAAQARARQAAHDHLAAGQLFAQALDLWRGTPVADIGDVPLAAGMRAQAQASRLALLGDRIEADLAGDHAGLVAELVVLNHEHPLDERFTGQLMRALNQSGRRVEACARYHQFRERLIEETGLDPGPRLRELYQQLLTQDEPVRPPPIVATLRKPHLPDRPAKQPALRELVGRDRDLATLEELVAGHRVVTIVGPPGVGKSAVAEQLVDRLLDSTAGPPRADQVWFLPVEAVGGQSGLVSALLVRAGGGSRTEDTDDLTQLRLLLRGLSATVLLDNVDNLSAGCLALIAGLTADGPEVNVVLTARRPAGLPGEIVYRLNPLEVPDEQVADVASLAEYPAIALFVARAGQSLPRFTFGPGNAPQVAAACRLLDGLPLAIELAAARLRMMSLPELIQRLRSRLDTLDPVERVAVTGLRASLQRSWSRLDIEAQRALGALSSWMGAFSSVTAEALLPTADRHPLDVLQGLVDHSLVLADIEAEQTRYRLPNTVRQFVQEQISAADFHRAHHRQAVHLCQVTAQAAGQLCGDRRPAWLNRLDGKRQAIEASLSWTVDHEPGLALELVASLWWWWCDRPADGRTWYRLALSRSAGRPACAARLQALLGAAVVVSFVRPPEALDYACQAQELAERIGSPLDRIRARRLLAEIAFETGDLAAARTHGDAALAMAIAAGEPQALGYCLLTVAYTHLGAFDLERARLRAAEALVILRRCADPVGGADAQLVITEAEAMSARQDPAGLSPPAPRSLTARVVATFRREHSTGQLARALVQRAWCSDAADDPGGQQRMGWLREAFVLHSQVTHRWSIARDLDFVADICVGAGDYRKAAILLGASDSVRADMDAVPVPRDVAFREPLIRECLRRLGNPGYRLAAALGAAYELAGAVAEVLSIATDRVS